MRPIRSIPAAVDRASATGLVLSTATRLSMASGAELHVVHAIELEAAGSAASLQKLTRRVQRELHSALDRRAAQPKPSTVEIPEQLA